MVENQEKQDDRKGLDNETLRKISQRARSLIIKMVYSARSGHPGGSLSIIDILTELYFNEMNIDPTDQNLASRDRLVMSKGHASPALYSILALRGYFPQELLMDFRKINSKLEGHVHKGVPGVETSTGSLGQGLGIGVGMALASKIDNNPYRVFVILGDGEIEEGNIWESLMAGSKYRLNNLVAILDKNGVQLDGFTRDIMPMERLKDRIDSFGWATYEFNGHDFSEIRKAMDFARGIKDKPVFLIAKTVKGKGVSYMENNSKYHGSPPANEEEYEQALKEIDAA
ncbi:MAG: transketolase [Candidatus Thermoplasmatota archaeon]|jgi:transketolase|nr:transketolase [Candidatus Thermoplasmatota archaeon]MCL5790864.1 transketolase [Candidatus Thermoplasmatota archaeon]